MFLIVKYFEECVVVKFKGNANLETVQKETWRNSDLLA